jgi:hypothetical protein
MLFAETEQTNGTFVNTFTIGIAAAPLRDLWFSTRHGLTSAQDPKALVKIGDGDLLSFDGHVVKTQQELRSAFGIGATEADLGLDAASVLTGGNVAFSTGIPPSGCVMGTGSMMPAMCWRGTRTCWPHSRSCQ